MKSMREPNKVEYVLSTYLSPPGPTAFTTIRHDQSVALWAIQGDEISLVRYWELERISGMKHHHMPIYDSTRSPIDLLNGLLAQENLTLADIAEVWGTPGLASMSALPDYATQGLPIHSVSHLFSGLCLDTDRFRDSTIVALAMDGGPDFTLEQDLLGEHWYAGAVSHGGDLSLFPVESPGLLWHASKRRFNQEPGTLMALAHASPVSIEFDQSSLLTQGYWGGFSLFDRCDELVASVADAADNAIRSGIDGDNPFSRDELVASATMKVIESVSKSIVERSIDRLLSAKSVDPGDAFLSMSGGFALNCPTNSHLLAKYGFRGLLVPPCANDSGQALGIGLLGFYARGDLDTKNVRTGLPYRGDDGLDIASALAVFGRHILDVRDFDATTFVDDLENYPVAWVDGAAEVGPRALGHRSLLGDPRRIETKDILNRIKQRQWWRPVAPIVLEDHVARWFTDGRPSPFMLETFPIDPEFRSLVPAVAHIDGSARIQTLSTSDEPFLAAAIDAFYRRTGVPIICNTSLNDAGEPIINNAEQALNFCLRKGIAVAYIGKRRYQLDVSHASESSEPQPRPWADFYRTQNARPAAVYNEDVDPEIQLLLLMWPWLRRLADEGQTSQLKSIARLIASRDETFDRRVPQFHLYWRNMLEQNVSGAS
ncbi:carbamoyltransferase [Nocardia sp. GAS34]|uniref:carbamoyltransferase C-terminal domain-containing protein n=1 Tax=unclassified Nocardia TaxID=2637762 RepID=UPI003D221993